MVKELAATLTTPSKRGGPDGPRFHVPCCTPDGWGQVAATVVRVVEVPDRETVEAFHAAAVEAGGVDNGRPGLRPHYHSGYYAAFVLDPDGNNAEAVFHGDH
jgi:hypothetical protein